MELKLLKRNTVYQGKVFNTIVDEVEYPSGVKTVREVAAHPGGAAVLGVFPDQTIFLIRQHRYPFGEFLWELPAGKLEPDEPPAICALREFEEETGYTAARLVPITSIYPSPGFCDEIIHLFLATELSPLPGGRQLEEGELTMTLHNIPLHEACEMIHRKEIVDAKTICALLLGRPMIENGR